MIESEIKTKIIELSKDFSLQEIGLFLEGVVSASTIYKILKNSHNEFKLFYTEDTMRAEYERYSTWKNYSYKSNVHSNKIVLHFQQHFYEAERLLLQDKGVYNKLIDNRKKFLDKSSFSKEEMLRGLKISGKYIGYSHFNPYWIKKFIDDFKPQCIYDPCGGWGHRLIGASTTPCSYIYNDIWDKSYLGCNKIIQMFNMTNCMAYNKDASVFVPPNDYDCVFTCPPYYNAEKYQEDTSFESLDHYKKWWKSVVDNCLSKKINTFAFVINSKYRSLLCSQMPGKIIFETPVGVNKSHLNKVKSNTEDLIVYSL